MRRLGDVGNYIPIVGQEVWCWEDSKRAKASCWFQKNIKMWVWELEIENICHFEDDDDYIWYGQQRRKGIATRKIRCLLRKHFDKSLWPKFEKRTYLAGYGIEKEGGVKYE